MLCQNCRRLAATTVQRASTTPLRYVRFTRFIQTSTPAPTRARASIQSTFRVSVATSKVLSRCYSDTSSATATNPVNPPASPEKPDYLDEAESAIWDKLVAEFSPTELMVQDISGGCGSMYGIEIASNKFQGTNMLKQQRMVNAVLGDQMKGWHGVQLRTKIP
ncbi:hypothetical protein M426DRAFT_317168 [Hypoxylon sp. CI-4A]|nr:hypothetical protein M426DRAFT_317168 [Hypoxylon sp. CI-4A]